MSTPEDQPRPHPVGTASRQIPNSGINRLRFRTSEDLLDEGARLADEAGHLAMDGRQLLLAVEATRATHSFESVIALCQIGRGVQAAMINRSLLEDVLDVHWVAANPDEAPELADQHERLFQLGERATFERFGRDTTPLDAGERDELARLLKLYDGFRRSWTLTSEPDRIALIKPRWEEPEAAGYIDQTYQVIQRQNNALLHSSPTAFSLAMKPGRAGLNREGPDQWWPQALAHGVLGYYLIARVLAQEFDLSRQVAEEAFFLASCVTKELSDEQTRGLGDGDPCPCGSRRAFAECHGS
jgi:SEC-C motif